MSASETATAEEEASADVRAFASAIDYFETHDLGDELEAMAEVPFEITVPPSRASFTIEAELSRRLRLLARRRGVSAETLLNLWVQEKVMQAVEAVSMAAE